MSSIHPTAIVGKNARIGEGCQIGAFAVVDDGAELGKNCIVREHAVVRDLSVLGESVEVHPFAVIGGAPQDISYRGEPTKVIIGDRVVIREYVTIHRGTPTGGGETRVASDAYIMAYSHVAHDCRIGKHVVIVNAAQLAGHVEIQDYAVLGGNVGVAQYCRVGRYAYIGGSSTIRKDVPPFVSAKGHSLEIQGINIVGLARRGFDKGTIRKLKEVYKIFYLQNLTASQAVDKAITELGEIDEVKVFVDFVKSSKVGLER